jgi:hypothetical protein
VEWRGATAYVRLLVVVGGICLALAACAGASSGDGRSTAVQLRVEVPTYGEFGLGSTVFRFTSPLTAAERRHVQLTMTTPSRTQLVAAAATVSRDGRSLTVVAGVARRRTGARHRYGLSVEGTATAQAGSVEGQDGYLVLGAPFVRASRASRYVGGVAHAGGPRSAVSAHEDPACSSFERALSRSLAPVLVSGKGVVRMPARMPRDGSRAVANGTPAGLVLDQIMGELCGHNFKSTWLRQLVARR